MFTTQQEVRAYEGALTLPTYAIRGENRNPVFRSQYGVAHIYPYTLLDDIEAEPTDKTYHTVVLENQYLRVTVITDLGGRVYSVFDKISEREVFYKNSVVRFAPLAIRGAFFSGGVEFSFPVAHAPTTCDQVNWDLRNNADGSASASIGGLEHLSGLHWTITLTLFPDRCALAQDVFLHNPGTMPGRYHYWTNASLDANRGTEFIYPLQRARSYEFAGSASWPFARLDLIQQDAGLPGMEGVPMWPAGRLQAPVNLRWQKNMLAQVSIFGRNVSWDYFGVWQHKGNHGYAHVAKSQDVAGMKLWSWGNAPVGVVNQTALTNDDSLYAETQCGAMETQLDFDFLQPGNTRTWREWWIPLRKIGGLTCASETIGAKLQLKPISSNEEVQLSVGLCPAKRFDDAIVTVTLPDRVLLKERCSFSPEKPWIYAVVLKAAAIGSKPLTLIVEDSQGEVILKNIQDREPAELEALEGSKSVAQHAAEGLYVLGRKYEDFDNREQAKEAYRQALRSAEDHKEARLRLGLLLLRSAQFKEADIHLARAEELGVAEGSYYRGLIALFEDRVSDAEACFEAARNSKPSLAAALLGLGRVALQHKDWKRAIRCFSETSQLSGGTVAGATLLAIALRHAGRTEEAYAELQGVLACDPLNHPALYEMALGNYAESKGDRQKLSRVLSDDHQYCLDLACYYADAGLPVDALDVLKMAWARDEKAMTAYVAAFVSHKIGDTSAERAWLEKARAASPDYGFPSRIEEVLALEFALQQDPQDSMAKYFLGNFLYAHERHDEAIQLWTEAIAGMSDYDVLYRNLGIAAWQRQNEALAAIAWFEKALTLNPHNQDLYLHLDELYRQEGLTSNRERLLEQIEAVPDIREDLHKHRITMMVELGHYQEALKLMATETFIPLEMDQSFHNVYVQALMMRAKASLKAGRVEEAIHDYLEMLEYPENLGVGAPTTRTQAHICYELGLAYEQIGQYENALRAWREAASEHHAHGQELFTYVQMALDKLSRYSELGLEA